MVLDSLEDELVKELNQLAHRWHCSAAQVTGWDEREELFEYHKKHAKRAYNIIGRSRLPWYKVWEVVEERPLEDVWREFKENGKDPAYAKYLQGLRDKLRNKTAEALQQQKDYADIFRKHAEAKKEKKLAAERARRKR